MRSCQMQPSSHCTTFISNIWFISNIISAVCVLFCCLYIPGLGWGPLLGKEEMGNENLLSRPAQIPAPPKPSLH